MNIANMPITVAGIVIFGILIVLIVVIIYVSIRIAIIEHGMQNTPNETHKVDNQRR